MSDEQSFCEKCGYTAPVVSAETGEFLFCAVCDARDRARDFRTERDEAHATLAAKDAEIARLRADVERKDEALRVLLEHFAERIADASEDSYLDEYHQNELDWWEVSKSLITAALADTADTQTKPGG